jgi:outer membrane protein OmpA-like peptidoglycan-associated protein
LGEIKAKELTSLNGQLGGGYQFNELFGLRLSVNAWQSKAGMEVADASYAWKWNYVAPSLDATLDLTNLLGGFNPERLVSVNVFAGLGANIAFKNDAAATAKSDIMAANDMGGYEPLAYLWDGAKAYMKASFGTMVDFNVTERLSIGLEMSSTVLSDKYNSKKAHNSDWYFNTLAGVKYAFGKKATKRSVPVEQPTKVVERVIEKVVEVPAQPVQEAKPVIQEMRRDVFFNINKSAITDVEMVKVNEIAEYMKANAETKVTISGYADKGTGSTSINESLSKRRAEIVAEALKDLGIEASRISTVAMGDSEQPHEKAELNRVSICIVK